MYYKFKLGIAICFSLLIGLQQQAFAYQRYNGGCDSCHGSFTGSTSTKGSIFPSDSMHEMHRGAGNMDTDCYLCHTNRGDNPLIGSSLGTTANAGIGCTGCHGRNEDAGNDELSAGRGAGLRQHHYNSGVTTCTGCHSDADPANYTPVGEDVKPQYYGTTDTNADMSCNPVQASGTNENWTIGDFTGLDNDGDGLYDAVADPDCMPNQNLPPVSDPNGPYNGSVGVAVNFDGTGSSDPDGSIDSYAWDFGDSSHGTGPNPTHSYAAAGTYTVTLTVTDNIGAIDMKTTTAAIAAPKKSVFLPWLPILLDE